MMNKLTALSQPINESEKKTTHKGGIATSDEKGTVHKGKYGNEYQGDEDDEDADKKKAKKVIKKANAPAEKRGRGRPAKGADKDGQVMKPDWSQFGAPKKDVKLKPWDKAKTTKHSLKDWIENLDNALNEGNYDGFKDAPMDKDHEYHIHSKGSQYGSDWAHNPKDVYHSVDDAKRVAGNMKKASNTQVKVTRHPRSKLAGPQGQLPESQGGLTATPMQGATAIKDATGKQVATAATPQAAAMMTKGEVTLNDPTKALGEEGGELQYEMYMSNGQTKRFMAPTKEAAVKKAKAAGAKSLIRLSKNFKAVGAPMRPQEMNERDDREDDEGYSRTKDSDDEWNNRNTQRQPSYPVKKQNPWKKTPAYDGGEELDEDDIFAGAKRVAGPGMNESVDWVTRCDRAISKAQKAHKAAPTPDTKAAVSAAMAAKRNKEKEMNSKPKDHSKLSQYNESQLNELSKDTLKSYSKKSQKDRDQVDDTPTYGKSDKAAKDKILKKRDTGMARAKEKMAEGKVSQLELDLKDTDFSDADFKKQYKKTRAEMKASMTPKKPADKKPTSKIKEEYGAQFSGNIDANDKMGRGVLGKKAKPHEDDAWESNLNNILTKRNARKDTKKPTSKIKESILRESHETMKHIINKFKHEVKNFVAGEELDNDLYEALFDYYCDMGEMPYGTAKARDGDPFEWVMNRFDRDVQGHDIPMDEAVRPENIPAVQRKQAGQNFPARLDQVNANDSRSHLPNLKAAGSKLNADPFGFGPSSNPVQFEGWTKQLDSLLAEGMNVVANTGLGDAPDSVTVAATDEDAQQLLDLVKSAGLGMFANTNPDQSQAMSTAPADDGSGGEANIEVVDDHDDMLSLIRRMSGQGNAAPTTTSAEEEPQQQESQECAGCSEGNCQTHNDQVVDEEDEEPGDEYDAQGNLKQGGGYDAGGHQTSQGAENAADEADYHSEVDEEDNYPSQKEREDHEEESRQSDGLDEEKEEVEEGLANEADQTFEADIDFMQNVISGGLNGKKRTQSVGNPVTVAASPMRESTNLLADWKKLSGL